MGLKVTILGCCGSYPGPGQACSGYLVQGEGTTIWVDAGSGTLANLQRHVDLRDVDAVILSHEHPDHWLDLHGAYVAAKYFMALPRLAVFAPASVRGHAYYSDKPLDWHDVSDRDSIDIGRLRVTFSRTDHGPETLAVRVDGGGRSLGYSADTGPGWSLSALGPGIDLALCEATIDRRDEGRSKHMSARQAGESGREADVGRLVITHLPPGRGPEAAVVEAADAFGREVDVAVENKEFEV